MHLVVGVLPCPQGRPQGGQVEVAIVALIKRFGVCSLGSFHMAVEFGALGGQYKELDPQALAGLLKGRIKLTPPIDLDGSDGKRKPLEPAL